MSNVRSHRVPPGGSVCVAVIGAGYVGLPTAATLAHFGHRVVCAENDPERFDHLAAGEMPIVEKDLPEMVRSLTASGTLRFVRSAAEAVQGAEFVFLCVPTPQGGDGSADLSFVTEVSAEIAPHLAPGSIVVNKSTVPVGTVTRVAEVIARPDVTVVSNPEFLREGTAVGDSLHPDRLVVGCEDRGAAARVGALFASTGAPLIVTDTATAETIKYASNAFLATKLSFVNAVASLCEVVGADVRDLILGLGYDRRIGFDFLRPGPGWGGSCLPKDTVALIKIADGAGYDFALLRAAIEANDEQLERVVDKVVIAAGGSLAGVEVGALGLTFKAGTDDRRNSPAVEVVRRLVQLGARVRVFDPTVDASLTGRDVDEGLDGVAVGASAYEAVRGAALAVVLTEWEEFRWLDFQKVHDVMARPVVVDARNLLDPAGLRRLGFAYTGIGRP